MMQKHACTHETLEIAKKGSKSKKKWLDLGVTSLHLAVF